MTRPIEYAKHRNSSRVHVTLALTWVMSNLWVVNLGGRSAGRLCSGGPDLVLTCVVWCGLCLYCRVVADCPRNELHGQTVAHSLAMSPQSPPPSIHTSLFTTRPSPHPLYLVPTLPGSARSTILIFSSTPQWPHSTCPAYSCCCFTGGDFEP